MRWIILALTLGTSVMCGSHGMLAIFGVMSAENGFIPHWLSGSLAVASVVLALPGGISAFRRNRMGSAFLMLAALLCIVASSEFWIYGSLYLIATVFCFFLPRHSDFRDDYDEEEEEDDDDAEALAALRELSPRRREQAARIPTAPRSRERKVPLPDTSEEVLKVRKRTSKTCPTCGANVAIDHRFCPTCGSSLHIPADADAEAAAPSVSEPEERELARDPEPRSPFVFGSVSVRSESDAGFSLPPAEESEPGPLGFEVPEMSELSPSDEFRVSAPHKVFVRPLKESTAIPARPLNIDPDASYQEFSQYARRRKRRTRSLGRRIFGVFFLLTVVGGTTWFLLGLRKLPENQLPVRPDDSDVVKTTESEVSRDVVAQPVAVVTPAGELPPLAVRERPERGRVTGSNVNLREDHSTASKSVTRLQPNARGDILDAWEGVSGTLSGVWYRIRTADNREGWIYGQYFQPLGDGLPKGYTDVLLKSFGADRAGAIAELGQPARSTAGSLGWQGLTITLGGEAITRLQVSAAGRRLKNGVEVGMAQKELLGIMGYPSQVASGQWRYVEADGRGMGVQFDKNGSVRTVTVGKL